MPNRTSKGQAEGENVRKRCAYDNNIERYKEEERGKKRKKLSWKLPKEISKSTMC